MTITEPNVATAATIPTPYPDTISPRPTSDQIRSAIMKQTGCSKRRARRFIAFLRDQISCARSEDGYGPVHLTQEEIDEFHPMLELVMPDDTASTPGSAHDLIERGLLSAHRGELSITHTKGGPTAEDCVTVVEVHKVG